MRKQKSGLRKCVPLQPLSIASGQRKRQVPCVRGGIVPARGDTVHQDLDDSQVPGTGETAQPSDIHKAKPARVLATWKPRQLQCPAHWDCFQTNACFLCAGA